MFTLCMSRGYPCLQNAQQQNNVKTKQIKEGYLLRYKRGLFSKNWCEEWFILYEDSTLAWFAEKGVGRPRGRVRLSETPELLAVGEWTRKVPKKPRFPRSCHINQLLAIGSKLSQDVHWLMAQSPAELNDWITAISNTLPPPPPGLPLEKQLVVLTPEKNKNNLCQSTSKPNNQFNKETSVRLKHSPAKQLTIRNNYNHSDHTVLSGVVIGWGSGWGWNEAACDVHVCTCAIEGAVNPTIYSHSLDDCAGFDDMDCCAFGDFIF